MLNNVLQTNIICHVLLNICCKKCILRIIKAFSTVLILFISKSFKMIWIECYDTQNEELDKPVVTAQARNVFYRIL